MDSATVFCPNLACPARGQTGEGNSRIHSSKDQRFLCTECHKTFSATKGTALYRLRTAAETVSLVVTLLAHGCPLHAIIVAFGFDERTVARWAAHAGVQGQAVQEHLVEQPRDLGQVQGDEIRVKTQRGIVWMALAMMVRTRLWLAGEVSPHCAPPLIRRLSVRFIISAHRMQVSPTPVAGQHLRWPLASRIIAGPSVNCRRFMCHRRAGHHHRGAGVARRHCNA